jgi:hypothetical protein
MLSDLHVRDNTRDGDGGRHLPDSVAVGAGASAILVLRHERLRRDMIRPEAQYAADPISWIPVQDQPLFVLQYGTLPRRGDS